MFRAGTGIATFGVLTDGVPVTVVEGLVLALVHVDAFLLVLLVATAAFAGEIARHVDAELVHCAVGHPQSTLIVV